jgi:GT2 family glycosyltransferase
MREAEGVSVEPTWVTEVEVGDPISDLTVPAGPGAAYGSARVLVRLHRQPLGFVTVPIDGPVVAAQSVVAAVDSTLSDAFRQHLERDGLPLRRPSVQGIPVTATPSCLDVGASDRPSVSVVLCTRDRADSLRVAVESILATGYRDLEVLLVDNAPRTSATRDVVESLHDPRLRYVLEPRPGLSRARNAGIGAAAGGLLAFTDDDVRVDADWIEGLARGLTRSPSVGLITGTVAPTELETRAQHYFENKVQWGGAYVPRLFDLGENRHEHPLYPYAAGLFGTGANFAITRRAFERVGPFDAALGAGSPVDGGEDLDYFLRVLRSGLSIAHEPAALVWHSHRRDDEDLVRQMSGYGAGLSAYVAKHLADPRVAADLVGRLPREAVRFLRANHQVGQQVQVPGAQQAELRGLLAGPGRYVRGRRQLGRVASP